MEPNAIDASKLYTYTNAISMESPNNKGVRVPTGHLTSPNKASLLGIGYI